MRTKSHQPVDQPCDTAILRDVSRSDRRCYGYPEPKTQTVTVVALPLFALTRRPYLVHTQADCYLSSIVIIHGVSICISHPCWVV